LTPIAAVLGCDVAAFKESEVGGERCKNGFGFLVMPIDPSLTSFPVHLYPNLSGSLKDGDHYCMKGAEQLEASHIRVLCTATDGDRGYMRYQEEPFAFFHNRLGGSLDGISNYLFCGGELAFPVWWIADLLSVLKFQR
jgi:hypothetical protein